MTRRTRGLALGTLVGAAGLALAGPVAAEGYMAVKPPVPNQEVEKNLLSGVATGSAVQPAMTERSNQPEGQDIDEFKLFTEEPRGELTAQRLETLRRGLVGR